MTDWMKLREAMQICITMDPTGHTLFDTANERMSLPSVPYSGSSTYEE